MTNQLGCLYEWDERNSNFPISGLLPRKAYATQVNKVWDCKHVLDQGAAPACVGFAFAHQMIADPYPEKHINNPQGMSLYLRAQFLDQFPGEDYQGTSTLGGVKAMQELYPGSIESYRWGDTKRLDDIIACIGHFSPVVISTNWLTGMDSPDKNGLIRAVGNSRGGHCYMLRGQHIKKKQFTLQNSWGTYWAKGGTALISFDDMLQLLQVQATICVPVTMGWWHK